MGGVQHGLFDFTVTGCTPSSVLNFTITYPQTLPPDPVLEIWSDAGRRVGQHVSGRGKLRSHLNPIDQPTRGLDARASPR